jgi:argininosuccinate lyase
VRDVAFDPKRLRAAAEAGFPTATDLADWVVQKLGLPFRKAHHIAGSIVRRAETLGVGLPQMPLAEMQKIEPGITQDVFRVLGLEESVASRTSLGGTAPDNVRAACAAARKRFL